MKKQLITLLLVFGLLAGCGAQPKDAAESNSVRYEQVTLYLPNDTADGLTEQTIQLEQNDPGDPAGAAKDIIQALETAGALPDGSEAVSAKLDNQRTLSVDLNRAFADGILKSGTAGETMTLASLVDTLWVYYEPSELILTADGKPVETGHNVYDEPFTEMYPLES